LLIGVRIPWGILGFSTPDERHVGQLARRAKRGERNGAARASEGGASFIAMLMALNSMRFLYTPQSDDMIKTFPPDRANQSFRMAILPWRLGCSWPVRTSAPLAKSQSFSVLPNLPDDSALCPSGRKRHTVHNVAMRNLKNK
jgi:hypothetical protein